MSVCTKAEMLEAFDKIYEREDYCIYAKLGNTILHSTVLSFY